MTTDSELLRQFAKTSSEDAFAELVKRHVNLVYSAALRQVNGDAHLAKDVAQTVFADLARKAKSLSRRETLTGWLYTSAHFAAAKIIRGENRRRNREEKFMREPLNQSSAGVSPAPAPDADWEKIRPVLDDAMHELKETDREAVLLRYFENRQFAEVGAKLGLNENAARMRVERALEKLRAVFAKRGITTATAFASVVSANAVQLAPANLAATLTTTSIATAGTGTFTLLKIMTATKLKLGISALIVATATTAIVIQHQAQNKLRTENGLLHQQLTQLQTDNESLSNRLNEVGEAKKLSDDQFNELLKLRGEVGVLRLQTNQIGKLQEENQQLRAQNLSRSTQANEPADALEHQKRVGDSKMNDGKALILALMEYAQAHRGQLPADVNDANPDLNQSLTGTNHFELVYTNSLYSLSNPASVILVREWEAWPTVDGQWAKVYGFADGHSEVHTEPDGNFGPWEQQHSPQPNQ